MSKERRPSENMQSDTSNGENKSSRTTKALKNKRPGKRIYLWLMLLALLVIFLPQNFSIEKEISWLQFKEKLFPTQDIDRLEVVNLETVHVYIKKESLSKPAYKDVASDRLGRVNPGPHYYFIVGSVETLDRHLDELEKNMPATQQVPVTYVTQKSWLRELMSWILPVIVFGGLWYFLIRRAGIGGKGTGPMFDFGKAKPQLFDKGTSNTITFNDVAGYEEAKLEVMETVEFLKHPEHFRKLGAKIPKGILLIGAPGTGKTLMAKAVAGEAGVPFFSLSGSEFVEMFVGVGASRVRDLFEKAKQKAPCIIFIDEIDTVGRTRGRAASLQANDERESTLNQLLAEMDGFDPNLGVIVLAATNRPDILDPALLRPGRFDRHIQLELPNKPEREAIFKVHLKPLTLDEGIDPAFLAAQTPGFSGADIANICNEAALIAARRNASAVTRDDFLNAVDRIVAGLEKKSRMTSPAEKKVIAYHEAGHAVTGWFMKHAPPLMKVSIIPRGRALGGSWYLPEDRQITTRSQLFDNICISLGGRSAEELVFNEASSGALDDLERATRQAYTMVAHLGLSDKLGPISFYDSTGIAENSLQKPYSETMATEIDEEVKKLLKQAHEEARRILEDNRSKLDKLAGLLIEKETVHKDEIELILGIRATDK